MSLYFIVILASLIGPFALSFDKKIHFYTYWRYLFPAIFIVAIPFIFWDEIFTQWGVWGFNKDYLNGFFIGNLPIEEVCFFIFVPYACVFIYEVLVGYFTLEKLQNVAKYFAPFVSILALVIGTLYFDRIYTMLACYLAALLSLLTYYYFKSRWFSNFILTYFIVQIPFFIVNGILTGMMTENPIVWYNESEITGFRVGTIPIEDFFYNFSMLLLVVACYNFFKSRKTN